MKNDLLSPYAQWFPYSGVVICGTYVEKQELSPRLRYNFQTEILIFFVLTPHFCEQWGQPIQILWSPFSFHKGLPTWEIVPHDVTYTC